MESVFHPEFGEWEAFIPALGRYLFTAAGSSREEALEELEAQYPALIQWLVKNRPDVIVPRPDIGHPTIEDSSEAQTEKAGLLSILSMLSIWIQPAITHS